MAIGGKFGGAGCGGNGKIGGLIGGRAGIGGRCGKGGGCGVWGRGAGAMIG